MFDVLVKTVLFIHTLLRVTFSLPSGIDSLLL